MQLKCSNYVAFSHFHGSIVNNLGLMLIVKHIPHSLIEIAHIQIGKVMITLEYTMKLSFLPQNIALK